MAVPAPVALPIIDPLPDWKREALTAARYGSITSAGFLLDRNSEDFLGQGVWRVPTVRSRLVSVTNPTITFPQEVKDRTGQGLLRVYTADAESKRLSKLSDGEALESLMEELYAILPDTRGHVITGELKHWEHGGSPWLVGRLAHVPNIQAPTDQHPLRRRLHRRLRHGRRRPLRLPSPHRIRPRLPLPHPHLTPTIPFPLTGPFLIPRERSMGGVQYPLSMGEG